MSDPQDNIKCWLDEKLKQGGVGSCTALANHLGVSLDATRRMRNRDGTKESRRIEAHLIPLMAEFFGEWPPGFEALNEITRPAREDAGKIRHKKEVQNNKKSVVVHDVEGPVTIVDKSINNSTNFNINHIDQRGVLIVGADNAVTINGAASPNITMVIAGGVQIDDLVNQIADAVTSRLRAEVAGLIREVTPALARGSSEH